MHTIDQGGEHLVVRFDDNFDYGIVQTIIHHITSIKEYPETNDLWIIGKHHADIHLGEVETMMKEFHCRCPREAPRTKTAIVVAPGITASIIELWVKETNKRVPFQMRMFHKQSEAEAWLSEAKALSA